MSCVSLVKVVKWQCVVVVVVVVVIIIIVIVYPTLSSLLIVDLSYCSQNQQILQDFMLCLQQVYQETHCPLIILLPEPCLHFDMLAC